MELEEQRKLQLEVEYSKKLAEIELKAIRAQINPHFIFNCLNSIQLFVMQRDYEHAQKYLSDFSFLIRKTLDFSRRNFITLADEIDISRGDIIAKPNNHPQSEQDLDLMLCWMNQKPVNLNTKFYVRHTSREVRGVLKEIQYKLDINSLSRLENIDQLSMNDIARVKIRTAQPLFFDSYRKNRITGSLILVDEGTNETVAAGMIV